MLTQPALLLLHSSSVTVASLAATFVVVQFDDQGIVNSDSRTIAVPHDYANFIPTDIRGTTFARTPAQVSHVFVPHPQRPSMLCVRLALYHFAGQVSFGRTVLGYLWELLFLVLTTFTALWHHSRNVLQ